MLSSTAMLVLLRSYQERSGDVWIAWPWWIVIGTAWTYFLGALFRTKKPHGVLPPDGVKLPVVDRR
jgi:hypothetical protein